MFIALVFPNLRIALLVKEFNPMIKTNDMTVINTSVFNDIKSNIAYSLSFTYCCSWQATIPSVVQMTRDFENNTTTIHYSVWECPSKPFFFIFIDKPHAFLSPFFSMLRIPARLK